MCFLSISASSPSSSSRRLKSLSCIFGRWDEPRSGFPLLRERRMERSSSFPFRYFAVKAVWTGGNDIDFYHVADPGTLRLHMDGLKPWRFADKLPSVATGAIQQQRHGFSDGGLVEDRKSVVEGKRVAVG